jgi:hypothetical protein
MFVARCPKCASELDVDAADRGHRVACPACRVEFLAEPPPPPPTKKPTVAAKRVPVTRRWDDDSDYVNETVVPPRHWLDREDDRGPDPLRVVRRELAWPANGLIWTGWIGFLLLIVGGVLTVVSGYLDLNSPYARGLGPIVRLALGAIAATLGSMYFAMIATGGGQMKRVRKRGSALGTAIMGMLTLLTCMLPVPVVWMGAGSDVCAMAAVSLVVAVPTAGFGLWALVVLNRPEVADAFERRKRKA